MLDPIRKSTGGFFQRITASARLTPTWWIPGSARASIANAAGRLVPLPFLVVLCFSWFAASPTAASEQTAGNSPVSASAEARALFAQGRAALDLFEYEDANEAFRRAQQLEPGFAMAYWGEAMTYDQILWRKEDIVAGRDALHRLGASPPERLAKAATATDKRLLEAIEMLFGDGNTETRHQKYADALARAEADWSGLRALFDSIFSVFHDADGKVIVEMAEFD